MKKKRFIKLLMSRGYSRNEAREYAEAIKRFNVEAAEVNKTEKQTGSPWRENMHSYSRLYENEFSGCGFDTEIMQEVIKRVSEAIGEIAPVLAEALAVVTGNISAWFAAAAAEYKTLAEGFET